MSALYEMLVSQSPPVYNTYLSGYPVVEYSPENFSKFSQGTCRSASTNTFLFSSKTSSEMPKRPCLVTRLDDHINSPIQESSNLTRHKKKVMFADDHGLALTQVRIMTEPSNVPPILSPRFLAEITRGLSANPIGDNSWEITFTQPASDYLQFRQKLELDKVCLENVILKEPEECVTGTIKVSNISFKKEVFVRLSSDSWNTYEDTYCNYVNSSTENVVATVLYDTFSFKFYIPPKARNIQFCICFRCDGQDFWDNNSNNNYILTKKLNPYSYNNNVTLSNDLIEKNSKNNKYPKSTKCFDAVHADIESWSEFASWNHLENSSPYW